MEMDPLIRADEDPFSTVVGNGATGAGIHDERFFGQLFRSDQDDVDLIVSRRFRSPSKVCKNLLQALSPNGATRTTITGKTGTAKRRENQFRQAPQALQWQQKGRNRNPPRPRSRVTPPAVKVYVNVCIYIYFYVYRYICAYIYIHIHVHVHAHVHVHMQRHIHMINKNIHTHIHMYVYVCTHACMHICM